MVNLLLVEDNLVDVDLFKEYIDEYNREYKISTINRLKSAISYLESNPTLDIIILDLNLPDSNGIQTFEKVLQVRGEVPIIVLTGMNDQELANQTISQGAGDYLVKNKLNPYVIHKSILHTIERERSRKLMQQRERQILQNQKMEAIGRLAGGIAHDFNNLITIISGYSNLVLRRSQELELGNKFSHPLREIIEASKGGAKLVEQLLLFSREKEINKEIINLSAILENLQSMLRRIIPVHIELYIDVSSDSDQNHYAKFNKTQLEQIIINLVVNAVDAIEDSDNRMQGRISISLQKAKNHEIDQGEMDLDENLPFLCLSISDNGIGMDNEIMEHIFDPFYTTKDEGKGTGLGLSTVYGLINSIQGQIDIQTKLGEGTTFNIYIPEYSEENSSRKPQKTEDRIYEFRSQITSRKELRSSKTVMIVEDNQSLRLLIVNILNDLGYNLIMFEHGMDAINYLKNGSRIDLIISDILMPKLNGKEFYYQVNQALKYEIPFLFISGYNEENQSVLAFINENNLKLLKKPFESGELQYHVDEILFPDK